MEEFFEPAYTVDFSDELTRKRIRSAKPGEIVKVTVRLTAKSSADILEAVGTRSKDGKRFDVRLTVDERFQDIQYNYNDVVDVTYDRGKC